MYICTLLKKEYTTSKKIIMKIKKTKQERSAEAKEKFEKKNAKVVEKMEKYGKLKLTFKRKDFNKVLSSDRGWGVQDFKEHNQLLMTELYKNYEVKVMPVGASALDCGVEVTIKTRKEQ